MIPLITLTYFVETFGIGISIDSIVEVFKLKKKIREHALEEQKAHETLIKRMKEVKEMIDNKYGENL